MKFEELEKEKKMLVETICWYQQKDHKDFNYNELIEKALKANSEEDLEEVWSVVDEWIVAY